MAEKNLVNETLLQIQNLEEVINENAKEILASTMKEEISELVKESMKETEDEKVEMDEAEDEELDLDDSEEVEDMDDEEMDMDDEDMEMDMDDEDMEMDMDDEDMEMDMEPIGDLTGETDFDKVFNVFKNMKNSDTVTVVPDGDYTKISDDEEDVEYLIQMESEEKVEAPKGQIPSMGMDEDADYDPTADEVSEGGDMYETYDMDEESEIEEVIYELEVDLPEGESEPEEFEMEEKYEDNESYNPMTEARKMMKKETKEGMKAKVGKGAKLGSAKSFTYKKQSGGFNEKKKQGKTVGLGKGPKFEFKEGEMMMGARTEPLSKEEAKEAARTYGTGWRKGALRKGARAGQERARKETNESVMEELQMLRTKNEEYRKALNLFRDKLNEVAIFNSNLAYATRLFTEHSTSKQEKINILRRFDTAETLKESKALYKTIKDELSQGTKATPITESIERVIEREPQSGSAVNLIESKTYENPQFLRMKDIMSKIAK